VKHYHIRQNVEGLYYLAEKHPFATIPELIYYHKHNCAGQLFVVLCHFVVRWHATMWGPAIVMVCVVCQSVTHEFL